MTEKNSLVTLKNMVYADKEYLIQPAKEYADVVLGYIDDIMKDLP